MAVAGNITAVHNPLAAPRSEAAGPISTNRRESGEQTAATLERNRLRSALLNAIVKSEARRRQVGESPIMESVSTEGSANSRVEVAQA